MLVYGVTAQTPTIRFRDISVEADLNISHIATPENRYIVESMSGGVALLDCNLDGLLDVATVNGSSVERFKTGGDIFITLYRQIEVAAGKTPKFQNVTSAAGITRKGWGMGVTAVDIDNDGILDLFVTGFGGNAVFKGVGGCEFRDVTEGSGLKGSGFMTGAAWADYDRDGDLDVMVPRYVSLDIKNLPVFGSSNTCSFKGIRVQCGPRGLPGETDLFFRNRGDGTFEEVASNIGVNDTKKYFGLGAAWCDFDNDGWPDIYVANDGTPNYLYRNERNGTFSDVSFQSGTSFSGAGVEQGSMGVAWGDYDQDGLMDLFVTNFDNEHNTLYRNLGAKGFLDVSMESKVGPVSVPYVGWGTGFVDFDNDGLTDLFVVNGHVYPQIEFVKSSSQMGFRQGMLVHRNLGNGHFEDVSKEAGLRDIPIFSSRGAVFGDLNDDGLVDVVITNVGEKPIVLLNTTQSVNQSITLKLVQNGKNSFAIGARVTIRSDKRSMIREVQAGSSYLSQNDLRLYFGLGSGEKIESVTVRWSDGTTENVAGVRPNVISTIAQTKGVVAVRNLRDR